jgi:uncharacterized protein
MASGSQQGGDVQGVSTWNILPERAGAGALYIRDDREVSAEVMKMKNGLFIIDADAHAADSEPIYRERLPERYRKRRVIFPADGFDRSQNGTIDKVPKSPSDNLRDNDIEGIDIQVIYPTTALMLSRIRERDYSICLAQTYNDWIFDWCSIDRNRLKSIAVVPLHVDVKESIREMERAVGKLGALGVTVLTYDRNRHVAHKDFWPFYEECSRQGVAVGVHSTGTETFDSAVNFDNFLYIHTFSHVPEQLAACTAFIYSGLLEVYPELRVAFLESGVGWVPYWMEHMDEEYELRKFDAPLLKMKPSEYMKSGRVYISCEPDEKMLPYVLDFFPSENILYASDYPHWDGGFPETVSKLADRKDLSEDIKRRIFFDNPQRFYDFKAVCVAPHSKI